MRMCARWLSSRFGAVVHSLEEASRELDNLLRHFSQWLHFPGEQDSFIGLARAVNRHIPNLHELVKGLVWAMFPFGLKYPPRLSQYRGRIGALVPDCFAQPRLQV